MPYSDLVDDRLLEKLAAVLSEAGLMMVAVESCTGGGVAQAVTSFPGSSGWFDRGWVTYSNQAKTDMVGVDEELLRSDGAVSRAVAEAMVSGALARSGDGRIAVAVTGIAGPDGGSPEKPVGTVFIAWSCGDVQRVESCVFEGDRARIRGRSVERALEGVIEIVEQTGKLSMS